MYFVVCKLRECVFNRGISLKKAVAEKLLAVVCYGGDGRHSLKDKEMSPFCWDLEGLM